MFRFLFQDHYQNSKYIDRETCILLAVPPMFHNRHCRNKFLVEKAYLVVSLIIHCTSVYRDGLISTGYELSADFTTKTHEILRFEILYIKKDF